MSRHLWTQSMSRTQHPHKTALAYLIVLVQSLLPSISPLLAFTHGTMRCVTTPGSKSPVCNDADLPSNDTRFLSFSLSSSDKDEGIRTTFPVLCARSAPPCPNLEEKVVVASGALIALAEGGSICLCCWVVFVDNNEAPLTKGRDPMPLLDEGAERWPKLEITDRCSGLLTAAFVRPEAFATDSKVLLRGDPSSTGSCDCPLVTLVLGRLATGPSDCEES